MAQLNPNAFTAREDIFSKCAPPIGTNIRECGTVTRCNAQPLTQADLAPDGVYMTNGDFRVMDSLLKYDFEVKSCEAVQNTLADFIMSIKVNMNSRLQVKNRAPGEIEVAPFVEAKQYSPINNAYWNIIDGEVADQGDPAGTTHVFSIMSPTNIPMDVGGFPPGMRLYATGYSSGGSATHSAWKVIEAVDNGNGTATLYVADANAGTYLSAAKAGFPARAESNKLPFAGWLVRGGPNVSDYEKWCYEQPTFTNWHFQMFWLETMRTTLCRSSNYQKWHQLALTNPLYRTFYELPETDKNRQLDRDWKQRIADTFMWGTALAGQNATDYALPEASGGLEQILAYPGLRVSDAGLITDSASDAQILGVDGATCQGRRANLVGVYQQHVQCGRVVDLQNGQFNLPAFFRELYNMMRIRKGQNHKNPKEFDCFTDSAFAALFRQAMITYFLGKSQGAGSVQIPMDWANSKAPPPQRAQWGFYFTSYLLDWPEGVVLNIITHDYFDDLVTEAHTVGMDSLGTVFWVLDWSGIYPGIVATNAVTAETGKLAELARINPDFACVMATNTRIQKLTSMTWTCVVECPMANLMFENIDRLVPSTVDNGATYGQNTSTTTTTTPVAI